MVSFSEFIVGISEVFNIMGTEMWLITQKFISKLQLTASCWTFHRKANIKAAFQSVQELFKSAVNFASGYIIIYECGRVCPPQLVSRLSTQLFDHALVESINAQRLVWEIVYISSEIFTQ